jgi:hypothetical protein
MTPDPVLFGEPPPPPEPKPDKPRRTDYTAKHRALFECGIHPATRRPVMYGAATCGDCNHHIVVRVRRTWHKCELHVLGQSHSEASDIRVSWPACLSFELIP